MDRKLLVILGAAAAIAVSVGVAVRDDPEARRPAATPTESKPPSRRVLLQDVVERLRQQRRRLRADLRDLRSIEAKSRRRLGAIRDAGGGKKTRETEKMIARVQAQIAEIKARIAQLQRNVMDINDDLYALQQRLNSPPGRCRFPKFRPAYLPWNPAEIPPPRRTYDDEIDRAQLLWTNPDDIDDGVAMTIYPRDDVGLPEKPIGVKLRGAEGYLHKGTVGEHSAWWNLDARCNFLELSIFVDELSPSQNNAEVVKVARSLR